MPPVKILYRAPESSWEQLWTTSLIAEDQKVKLMILFFSFLVFMFLFFVPFCRARIQPALFSSSSVQYLTIIKRPGGHEKNNSILSTSLLLYHREKEILMWHLQFLFHCNSLACKTLYCYIILFWMPKDENYLVFSFFLYFLTISKSTSQGTHCLR